MDLSKPLLDDVRTQVHGDIEMQTAGLALIAKTTPDLVNIEAKAVSSLRFFESKLRSSKTTVIKYKSAFVKLVVLKKKADTVIVAQNGGILGKFNTKSQSFVVPLINTGLEEISSLVVTASENYVIVSGKKNEIKVYELKSDTMMTYGALEFKTELKGHTDNVSSLTVVGDKLLSVSSDKSLWQWNLNTFEGEAILSEFPQPLVAVVSTPKQAFVADNKGQIFQVDLAERKILKNKAVHEAEITAMKLGRLLKYFITGDTKGEIKVWSTATFEPIKNISLGSQVTSISFGDRDAVFAVGGENDVVIYDVAKKGDELRYEGHTGTTRDVHFYIKEDHTYLYSSSDDKSLRISPYFKSNEESNVIKAEKLTNSIERVYQFEKYLLVLGSEWQVWDLKYVDEVSKKESIKLIVSLPNETTSELAHELIDIKYSSRHNLLSIVSSTTGIYLYNTKTWELAHHLEIEDPIKCIFHPNLDLFYVADLKGKIIVRKLPELEKVSELQEDGDSLFAICYAPGRNYLFAGGEGKTVFVWDLSTDTCVKKLADEFDDVFELLVTPDEKHLIVWDDADSIFIWNLEDYSLETVIPPSPEVNLDENGAKDEDSNSRSIEGVLLSKDGKYLFVAWDNKVIVVWSIETRTKVTFITTYEDLENIALDTDGKTFYYSNSEGISTVPNPILNTEYEIYNPKLSLNESYKYLYKLVIEKKEVEYDPNMDWVFVAPYNLTMSSIYSYYGYANHLKKSLKSHFCILRDIYGFTPLSAALESKNTASLDILISSIVTALATNKFVATLVRDQMVALNKVSPPSLHLLYEALWRAPTNVKLAQFTNLTTALPIISLNTSINLHQEDFFFRDENSPVGDPSEYRESLIPLEYTLGSEKSLEFLTSLDECQNQEIFKTPLIREVLLYKWNKAKYYVVFQTLIYLIYMILLGTITWGLDIYPLVISLLATNGLLFGFELMQMVITGTDYWFELWNYIDLVRSSLCFLYVYGFSFWGQTDEYTVDFLSLLSLFSWVRGITYFRLFKGTRYFINLLLAVFEDMGSFLVLLIYSTMSYVFIRMIYDKDPEHGFADHLRDSFVLNFGDLGEGVSTDPIVWIVMTLMMLINPIIMLNLLISILSDTYSRVQTNSAIADMKELNDMILEVEQTMFWNKSIDDPRYLTKCYAKGTEENLDSRDPVISAIMKKVISLKTHNKEIADQFEAFKTQQDKRLSLIEAKLNVRGRHGKVRLENIMNVLAQVASKIDPEISTHFEPLSDSDAEQNAGQDNNEEYEYDEEGGDEEGGYEEGGDEEGGAEENEQGEEGNEEYENVEEGEQGEEED
jgi:WD40 repeat protein